MKRISARLIFVVLLGLGAAACVSQQNFNALQQRVAQHGERLDSVEQIRPNQANLSAELDALRSQIADLRGRMDELERRFLRPSPSSLPPYSEEPDQTMQQERMEPARQPAAQPVQPEGPSATDEALADLGMTTDQAEELGGPEEPAPMQPDDPARQLYEEALAQFKARNYETAQIMWSDFVKDNPQHELVPNALFWQGEAYYQMQQYPQAILSYQEVIAKHGSSSKYPAALLKQGISFITIGKERAGKLQLNELIRKYPDSPEAQRARDFLKNPG
ncbi:MAG: tol-pal system protein YbgF [Oceanidesulfovibrio sp.]